MTGDFGSRLKATLTASDPSTITPQGGDKHAAVTLTLGEQDGQLCVLFVRRAEWVNDPWSGHTALPGGHVGRSDTDLIETARRETLEEVGLDIPREAFLGRLDDLRPSARSPSIVVSPFVAAVQTPVDIRRNKEIQSHRWIPVSALRDPQYRSELSHLSRGLKLMFPSIVFKGFTIWGLTHQIVSNFLEIAGDT
jgi:8-oxo-dGTP pyrophosphatase MutT (NUDIX family)